MLTDLLLAPAIGGVPCFTGDGVARAEVAGDGLATDCTTPSSFLMTIAAFFLAGTRKSDFEIEALVARLADCEWLDTTDMEGVGGWPGFVVGRSEVDIWDEVRDIGWP